MSARAAGEGGNPLQRRVGSPSHTGRLGGGDCSTFIPIYFDAPLHALLLHPVILGTSSSLTRDEARGTLGTKIFTSFLCGAHKRGVAMSPSSSLRLKEQNEAQRPLNYSLRFAPMDQKVDQ